jgi:hypothetical protein
MRMSETPRSLANRPPRRYLRPPKPVRYPESDRLHDETPLRIWDRMDGDLVERDLSSPESRLCDTLGLYWHVRADPILVRALRLTRDADGNDLVLTPEEERAHALARVAELEAELARRK